MPLSPTQPGPDTTELQAQGQPSVPTIPALPDDSGTGANGPKYSTADFWSGVARNTVVGRAIDDVRAARGASYSPLERGTTVADPYAAIPENMKPFADKYVGLHTAEEIQYRTNQLRSQAYDAQNGASSKWAPVANLAAGLVDPVGVASMMIPIAGETRIANAVRLAAVGAGVSATDEAIMRELDPNWTLANAMKDVGAGTLVSGLLGGLIRPHVNTSEFERMRSRLQEDLNATAPEPPRAASGDSAASIAADLRAAIEAHGQGLEATAQAHTEGTAAIDPAEVQARLSQAQAKVAAAGVSPEERAAAVKAEVERLQTGTGTLERLQAAYGEELPKVLQERAEAAVDAKNQATPELREAALREVEAAQEDADRLARAHDAEQALAAFHETEGAPGTPPGYTGQGEPNGPIRQIHPEGEPGVRPELQPEQESHAAGGGQPAGQLPGRSPGGGARGAQRERGRGGPAASKGRTAHIAVGAAPHIEAHIVSQLEAAGRTPPERAGAYAALVGDFYATQAKRLGLSPDELFALHPLKITGEPGAAGFRQDIDVHEGEMTPEMLKLFEGLRTEPGGAPVIAHRGGRSSGPLTLEHFERASFGAATNRPSSGLGVFLTSDKAEAGRYGQVSSHRIRMKNPLELYSYELPPFDSIDEAYRWREQQRAKGYDGLVIDASNVGGQTWYVPFEHGQAEHVPAGVREPGGYTGAAKGRKITDPYTRDLFGEPVPARGREAGSAAPAGDSGPVSAAGGLSRDDLPAGKYSRHTELVTDSKRELGTDRVTSPSEAAEAFTALGRGAKERFDALVTDKDGKPLAIVGSSVGAHDQASVFPSIVAAEAFRIKDAAHIWFGHNHPSGIPELSPADRQIAEKLENVFRGSSIEPHGIHAIAGGAATAGREWHYASGGREARGVTTGLGAKVSVPVVERVFSKHEVLGPAIGSPSTAVRAARDIAGKDSGVILADNRNNPIGFVKLSGEDMRQFRGTPMMDAMHRALSVSNANKAFIVTNGAVRELEVANMAKFLRSIDVGVYDVIDTAKGQTWSTHAQQREGLIPGLDNRDDSFRQANRGSYDPSTHTIALSEATDASTFLHESGHHFLDLSAQLAAHPDAPLSMREDMQTLLDWFKVKDLDEWHGLGLEGQRDSHEKFARGFEQYLKDGTAPSSRLQAVFDKFREWLSSIYKGVVNQFGERLPADVRAVMDRMLASETEKEEVTAARVAAAPTPNLARVAGDGPLRDELRNMAANEVGWAEVGGKMIRRELNGGRGNEFDISRTSWIPNAEWWPGRPGGYNPEAVQGIIDKALAGEKLGPKQAELVDYMTEVADQRVATEPYLPHAVELDAHALEHTPANAFEAGMVARLSQIDEDAVETLARHFENDDAGFMRKVKELLDAHDTDAKLASSVPQDQEPLGLTPDRGAAGRSLDEAGARGQEPRAAAAESERPASRSERPRDLFGESPSAAQSLADETRRRDLKRNSGQDSLETGNPGDLFSQARQQADLTDMLAKLPPEKRAPFEARMQALPEPGHEPIVSAPGDSTAGAAAGTSREAELHDYSLARGGRVLGKALGWFAPGSRALSSPFLSMRKTMARLIEMPEMLNMNVPSPERPFGQATPIAVQTLLKHWEGNWAKAFKVRDDLFRQFRARKPELSEDALLRSSNPFAAKRAFNEAVAMAMRRGDHWFIDEVEQAAQATRKIVFDPLKLEAQKLGLLPMQEDMLHGTAESYLLRQYDRSKIKADQLGWHQTLHEGFVAQGVDTAEAHDVAHAVTRNILGTELGLLDSNKSVFNHVEQSGRLKARTLKLPDLALEKYLTSDIDTLSHSYLKSLAPQVEMMKMFRDDLRNDGIQQTAQAARVGMGDPQAGPSVKEQRNLTGPAKDITDEHAILKQRALAKGDNAQANALDKRLRSDLRDLAGVRDRLYGIYGAPSDSASWIQRAGRVIRSVNALRLLGTATWSHVPDLANIVMKRGLPQTMATAAKLSTSLEALNLNREQMHRVGAAVGMIQNSTAAALGEFGVESSYALQKGLNRATRAFTIATLETPWIATCNMLAGAAAHDEVLAAASQAHRFSKRLAPDFSQNERIRFNQMGLDQPMLERIAAQFGEYGKTVNGLKFGMTDQWHDQGAAQALDGVTASAAEGSTLAPGAGDTPLWTSSEVGKAIFQFKTFGAVAIRRVTIPLAQGLAHGDLRSAQGLATLIAAGALTYTMKQLLSGQPIEKDPGRYALEVLDKSNLLGWTGEYFYPSLWQFGLGNFSRWGDRQTWETLGGPVAGTAVDAWDLRLPAKIYGSIKGPGAVDASGKPLAHVTRSDIHRVRRMLPGNQVWYWRRAVNALEGKVGDAMGLPPEAPRGSSE